MMIEIKKELLLTERELSKKIEELDKADEIEKTDSRESLMMWLGFELGLPRELVIPITEHVHKFFYMRKEEKKYTKNDVDFAYLMGVFNTSGIDGLSNELQRLKGLGRNPHEIIDSVKNNNQK